MSSLEVRWDAVIPTLATREQLEVLRGEMNAGFAAVRVEMHTSIGGLVKWVIGLAISLAMFAVTAMALVLSNVLPQARDRADLDAIHLAQARFVDEESAQ